MRELKTDVILLLEQYQSILEKILLSKMNAKLHNQVKLRILLVLTFIKLIDSYQQVLVSGNIELCYDEFNLSTPQK